MAWGSFQITGEISIFWNFFIFVGFFVWLVNPILMGNVEVLLMFLMLSQPHQMIYLDLDLVEKLKTPHHESYLNFVLTRQYSV